MNIQQNISLKPFNTFGLEASAQYFVEVNTVEELKDILQNPNFKNLDKLFLGGGSNLLLTKNYEGLVIKIALKGIEKVFEDEKSVHIKAGAGEVWHQFVMFCVEHHYAGIENLSLIPGTVGAAPMQNIGAYGVEIKDVFQELEALNLETLEIETFSLTDCQFGYRESVFKHSLKGKYVITSVTFHLNKVPTFKTAYGDIQKTLAEMNVTALSIKAVSDAVISIRKSKLPDPAEIGNSGSFFKNPEIPIEQYKQILIEYPTLPSYPINESTVKVPAGWLIEQAGWKGFRDGQIGVHARQALVLVNYGGGNGNEIKKLAEKVQESVLDKFGIKLSPEVNYI
ncbi:UDP-N-acetylmuramate dehydrogenase [Arcicella sp. DC2W]|uniref:UDP-N-acetylenolpyruvoylglucosamine reductase n=1 Tax=Arcicella gelida TaxID=2984195 RepID=A0ABU5S001_9BACT|nr:UDP-N-acetylmuramate dehydrogenase [Arcicella sp. DC2W]MEA5401760.1 UDP-N-acetylmuramate dehydrogenase [Arcicella sp. DC2W]